MGSVPFLSLMLPYRFWQYELGAQVILSGTGNPDNMQEDVRSFTRPLLPEQVTTRLKEIFEHVDSITGQ
jgi:hypothetical protein